MSKKNRSQKEKSADRESWQQRLERHPELRAHLEALLTIVENRDGSLEKADDAELAVLEQVRQLGRQALGEWAQRQADRKAEELPQLNPSACRDKKNSPLA